MGASAPSAKKQQGELTSDPDKDSQPDSTIDAAATAPIVETDVEVLPEAWIEDAPEHVGEFHATSDPRNLRTLIMKSWSDETCQDEECSQSASFMVRWAGAVPAPQNVLKVNPKP